MQSDFESKALKKAKNVLQKHLDAAQKHQQINDTYRKELFKPSLWERIRRFFGRT